MICNKIREVFLKMSHSLPKIDTKINIPISSSLLDSLLFTHEIGAPCTLIPICHDPNS